MIPILEYIISKNNKTVKMIHVTDATIQKIVKDELDRLGHDADLNHIDVSEVTDMSYLFSCDDCDDDLGSIYKDLNPNISLWDVSNVKTMRCMFYSCENFDCDISDWNVHNVKNMSSTFWHCNNFNQDLSSWDVRNVEHMNGMFFGCKNFNQDLSEWDVSKVKDTNYMFYDCPIKEEYKPKFNI